LDALQEAINHAGAIGSKWEKPFNDLHAAATKLFADPAFSWPDELANKPDVTAYLIAQGL
jgi:hypothetical protein